VLHVIARGYHIVIAGTASASPPAAVLHPPAVPIRPKAASSHKGNKMRVERSLLFPLAVAMALLLTPSTAFAAIKGRIVEGVGIKTTASSKTAKLGLHDTTDDHRISSSFKRTRDDSYAGLTVYLYRFGKKSAGHYPVQMYSKANHHVFTFVIYTSRLATANGTHVGTTESDLTVRYGSQLTRSAGPVYTQYYMGTRTGRTEFWVSNGAVHHIVISRY
jgi:hypothetical protein